MTAIAGITTFDDLRAALAQRKIELRMTNLVVDDVAGLQQGYTGKILCGVKRPGDMSLPAILGALGVELAIVPSKTRHSSGGQGIHSEALARQIKKRREASSAGGKKCFRQMTEAEKHRHQKRAAQARWKAYRAKKAAEARAQKAKCPVLKDCDAPI